MKEKHVGHFWQKLCFISGPFFFWSRLFWFYPLIAANEVERRIWNEFTACGV